MSYMFVLLKYVCMLMRDIDWWCLIGPCLYGNERYRLMETCLYVNNERYRLVMSYEPCLYVNERNRLVMSYETCLYVNERYRLMMSYWKHVCMLMRDIDWWCLMYVNEWYRLMNDVLLNHVCMLMRDIDWWCLMFVC